MSDDARIQQGSEANPDEIDAKWTEVCIEAAPELQDQMLVDALVPFVRASRPGKRVFFVRDRVDEVTRIRTWVTGCSSIEVEGLANAYRDSAARLGSAEVRVAAETSLDSFLGPYGGNKAAQLFSGFFVDLAPLLLDQIGEIIAGRASRLGVATDIMCSHLYAIDVVRLFPERYPTARPPAGCPAMFPVYRANVDGFFIMSVKPEVARERMNEQYERRKEAICARVAAVLAQFHDGPPVSEVGFRWQEIATRQLYLADQAIASDDLTVKWDTGYLGDNFDLSVSPFHQVVQDSAPLRSYFKENQAYLAARFLVSSMYLALATLGVRIMERFFLCHSITRACEEIFGIDTVSVLKEMSYAAEEQGF